MGLSKEESVYQLGDLVRFVTDPDTLAIVTGIVYREGGCTFIVSDRGNEVEVGLAELIDADSWVAETHNAGDDQGADASEG